MFNPNAYAAQQANKLQRPVFAGLPGVGVRGAGATVTDLGRPNEAPIEVMAMPSVKIVPRPEGGVTVRIELRSKYADSMSFDELHSVAQAMVDQAKAQSTGPLTARMLKAMGNPYGRDKEGPRRLPKGLRYVKGVRGSVPDLTVINKQSGILRDSWDYDIAKTATGAAIEINNSAPYAVFLASGTRRMQTHGPFSYIATRFRSRIMSAWQKEVRAASLAASREMNLQHGIAANLSAVAATLGVKQ